MIKTLSPGLQFVFFIFIVYFFAGLGELIYTLSIDLVVDEATLLATDWSDPRVTLSRTLFFQIFAFLLSFLMIQRLIDARLEDTVHIGRIQLRPLAITCGVFLGLMLLTPLLSAITEPLSDILPSGILEREMATDVMQEKLVYHDDPIQFAFILLFMGALPAICEELVFRGFLIKKIVESSGNENAAVVISALLFSLIHLQPLKVLTMFVFGLALGFVYVRFRNIKYAMVLHFLINASQIILGYLIGSGLIGSTP